MILDDEVFIRTILRDDKAIIDGISKENQSADGFYPVFLYTIGNEAEGSKYGMWKNGKYRRKRTKQKRRAAKAARLIKQPLMHAALFEGDAEELFPDILLVGFGDLVL